MSLKPRKSRAKTGTLMVKIKPDYQLPSPPPIRATMYVRLPELSIGDGFCLTRDRYRGEARKRWHAIRCTYRKRGYQIKGVIDENENIHVKREG